MQFEWSNSWNHLCMGWKIWKKMDEKLIFNPKKEVLGNRQSKGPKSNIKIPLIILGHAEKARISRKHILALLKIKKQRQIINNNANEKRARLVYELSWADHLKYIVLKPDSSLSSIRYMRQEALYLWKYDNRVYKKITLFVLITLLAYSQNNYILGLTIFLVGLISLQVRFW